MPDNFDITQLEQIKSSAEYIADRFSRSKSSIQDTVNATVDLKNELNQLSKTDAFDLKQFKEANDIIANINKEIVSAGADVSELVKIREKENKILKMQEISYDKLTKEGKKRVQEEAKKLELGKRYVKIGDKTVEVSEKETKSLKKSAAAFGSKAFGMAKYAASMVGVQFSLAFLVSKLIEAYDRTQKLGAMSTQVNSQFAKGTENIKQQADLIYSLRQGFKISVDMAGQYVNSLAKAGMEKNDILKLSKSILATEFVYGQSVQEQTGYIKGLATNFNVTNDEAFSYLQILRESAKEIPNLDIGEATKDWADLIDKTKVYNVDLLGTLALYESLMDKDISKTLGLGDAPRAVKKQLVETIVGSSKEASEEAKAWLGQGLGETISEGIIAYENLLPEQQFAITAQKLMEQTQIAADKVGDRIIMLRHLLAFLGYSQEEQKLLAEKFAKGAINKESLATFLKDVKGKREELAGAKEKEKSERDALIKKGMRVATGLMGLAEKIAIALEPIFTRLLNAIFAVADAIFELMTPKSQKEYKAAQKIKRIQEEQLAKDMALIRRVEKHAGIKAGGTGYQNPELLAAIGSSTYAKGTRKDLRKQIGLLDLNEHAFQKIAGTRIYQALETKIGTNKEIFKATIKDIIQAASYNAVDTVGKNFEDAARNATIITEIVQNSQQKSQSRKERNPKSIKQNQ